MSEPLDRMMEVADRRAGQRVTVMFTQDDRDTASCAIHGEETDSPLASAVCSTASEAWAACIQQMRDT